MTEKIRRTWRHLAYRVKISLVIVVMFSVALTVALALDDAYIPWGDSRHLGTNDDIIDSNFPSWFGMAFKTGAGVWDTNIPAWCVLPDETNEAALDVLFNRSLLTNSLIMKLDYLDTSNASLALDLLLMTNQIVMKSNLFENILTGSGVDTSRTFNVSLLATNTVGLQFRRGTGSIMLRDTLLSPDSDGDGYSDTEELAWGSDPNSALSVPCATITGQVFYAGVQPGVIHVLAATNANDWTSAYYLTMTLPPASSTASFTLSGLPLRRTFYARAWRDVNNNQLKDYWEPCGTAVPVSLYLGSNTGNVMIAMTDPDSDGDGMSDAAELAFGLDPLTSNTYARLPFIEGFETNTVHLGDLDGQNGWQVSMANVALVQTGTVYTGTQALDLNLAFCNATVRQLFAAPVAKQIWVDMYTKVVAAALPTGSVASAVMFNFNNEGQLVVWDGLTAGTNHWTVLTNAAAVVGSWGRVTVQLDYDAQTWLICLNGIKKAEGLGFALPTSELHGFATTGSRGSLDNLTVSTNVPSGLSLDGDNLPDDWEMAHFGNLDQTDDGDPDHDGLTNLQEYQLGTDPMNPDTDGDGMPDGWEVAHGLNPLVNDAALDPDHDGLTNLQEYQHGTDPHNPDTDGDGLMDGDEVNIYHTNPLNSDTDGDGMPDGWEVAHGLNPLMNDAALDPDNDGLTNLQEYQHGTDPHNPDTDGDGLSDGNEVNIYHTNPLVWDTLGDGISDGWKVAHGFNLLDPSTATQDPDHDGLTNLQEYRHGTDPHNPDTDGDGMSDGFEVLIAHSNPLVWDFDGAITTVGPSLKGSDASGWFGDWSQVGDTIYAGSQGGYVDYPLSIPSNCMYVVAVEVTQHNPLTGQDVFDLSALVDGVFVARQVVQAASGTNASAVYFLPKLGMGAHVFRIQWNNKTSNSSLQINSVKLQLYGGPDANANGVPDWEDYRLANGLTLKHPPASSFVSPICLEGQYLLSGPMDVESSFVLAPATNGAVPVNLGIESEWYANVDLSPTDPTTIRVFTEDGAAATTGTVSWIPFNILDGSLQQITIRQGDSLLLSAIPSGRTTGSMVITVEGVTNYTTTISAPVPHCFASPGLIVVRGTYVSGNDIVTAAVTVKVVAGSFSSDPACWLGHSRLWACPALPPEAAIQYDDGILDYGETNSVGQTGRVFCLTMDCNEDRRILARLGVGGPILGGAMAHGFQMLSDNQLYVTVVNVSESGDRLVETAMLISPPQPDVDVKLQIIVGGVVFDDGSTVKIIHASDFDSNGTIRVRYVLPPNVRTSVCHVISLWQGNVCIGRR